MTPRPIVIVGYAFPILRALPGKEPDGSVVLVEEPDVVRKRDIRGRLAGNPVVRELVEWAHTQPGTADEFYNHHRDLDPVAVIPLVEYATPFAARLAERYGLPGATLGAARIMRDKAVLRRVTAAAGVPNPESVSVAGPEDVRAFMADLGGPIVLKPANRQAAVGTQIIHDPADVDQAWASCVQQDEGIFVADHPVDLRMLAERYVHGAEYSVEMLVRDGEPLFANVTGKQLYPGPHPVELAHAVPAEIPDALTAELGKWTHEVVTAVGFAHGIVHCEWIVSDGVPYLVECAGRIAGDGIMEIIDRAYDVDTIGTYFALLKGEPVAEMPRRAKRGAAVRFVPTEPGVIEAVRGVEEARESDGVFLVDIPMGPGHRFAALRSSWDRSGLVMTTADTAAEALRRAEKATDLIHIDVR
ncbi:ATP-grasp domain-containing protein [Kibdelosporangium lantanae]